MFVHEVQSSGYAKNCDFTIFLLLILNTKYKWSKPLYECVNTTYICSYLLWTLHIRYGKIITKL